MTVQKLRIGNEDVDIGDENLPYMSPYIKIRRWGGAFGFGLDIPLPSGLSVQGQSFVAETNDGAWWVGDGGDASGFVLGADRLSQGIPYRLAGAIRRS